MKDSEYLRDLSTRLSTSSTSQYDCTRLVELANKLDQVTLPRHQACHIVLTNFCNENMITNIQDEHMLQSSTIAVAMEYLEIIKDDSFKEYAASRGGTLFIGHVEGKVCSLSFRELLSLLQKEE